jgi:hypothetical protein
MTDIVEIKAKTLIKIPKNDVKNERDGNEGYFLLFINFTAIKEEASIFLIDL